LLPAAVAGWVVALPLPVLPDGVGPALAALVAMTAADAVALVAPLGEGLVPLLI
jgi:hypothetical protein